MYKPSMFNHYAEDFDGASIILFNSYRGLNYIVRVLPDKVEKVTRWLSSGEVSSEEVCGDEDFEKLKDLGYFVAKNTNEKLLREALLSKARADGILRLVIHISKDCNFRCKYCYLYFNDVSDPKNITQETQDGIINFIRKNIGNYKAVHIDWFGGEPLLDVGAIEYISKNVMDICSRYKKPYEAVITTNGYLLTPKTVDTLIKCKVRHIAVTIDGLEKQHDSLRVLKDGRGTFTKIISNLKYIKENIRTPALSISLRSNLTTKSMENLREYYSFYNDIFGNDSRFSLFVRPVKNMGGENIDKIDEFLFENSSINFGDVYEELSGLIDGIRFDSNFVDLLVGGMRCYSNNLNRFTIGTDGLITKCDESLPEIGIGTLLPTGDMIIDEEKHAQWICSFACKEEKCDNCFYSCCCFMDPCPKARITKGTSGCPASVDEIDSLLRFCARSYEVKSL